MKIEQLHLSAYGPFTDRTLTFDGDGLHVVYGANEAGKSSALRALTALLYGIDAKTGDSFEHANTALRIGGLLRARDGGEIAFARRKGRTKTLLDSAGNALDDATLTPFLQGVSRELFQTLFGIDHQALVRGGQEILEQKGDVGRALFSAALGSNSLNEVLAGLEDEAAGLFKPRGSTQPINAALKNYSELKKAGGKLELTSTEWQTHRKALDSAVKELASVESTLADQRAEISRLERMQRVLPKLARARQLHEELAQMGEVVQLREGFSGRREDALRERENAQTLIDRQTPRLHALQAKVATLSINKALLSQSEKVEALHARLGEYRRYVLERPRIEAEYQQLLSDAGSILKTIRPDLALQDIDVLRPILARKRAITEQLKQHPLLLTAVQNTESALSEERKRAQEVRSSLDDLPGAEPTEELRREIAAARRHGELDNSIENGRSELLSLQTQCNDELSRLGRWEGKLAQITALALPDRAVVDHFEEQYQRHAISLAKLEEQRVKSAEAVLLLQQQLDEIARAGQVETEASLLAMRQERDTLWHSLQHKWKEGNDTDSDSELLHAGELTLHEAFEHRMLAADEISDRLRREADRVLKLANLQSRLQSEQQQAQNTAQHLLKSQDEQQSLELEWRGIWTKLSISAGTPKVMRAWIDSFESLRDRVQRMQLQQQSINELDASRSRHVASLGARIKAMSRSVPSGEAIDPVVLVAETLADEHDEIRRRRETLQQNLSRLDASIETLDKEHQSASKALETWQREWAELLHSLGLPADTRPAEMDDLIESIRQVVNKHDESQKRQIDLDNLQEVHSVFTEQVEQMVDSLTPELKGQAADDAVSRLTVTLSENQTMQTELKQLQEQIEHDQNEIQQAGGTIEAMNRRLDVMCEEAGCDEHAQLESVEKRHDLWLQLKASIISNNKDIIEASDGVSIEELHCQAEAADPDTLPSAISRLQNTIMDELEPRRAELIDTRARESVALERMKGGDDAAQMAEQASAVLAGVRTNAERYVQVKLAARVLRDQIERYRRENQGPLVKRASEHFAALTLDAFEALVTDFNDKDEPVLAGIRATGGNRVYVDGMSSGTLDQLYLALRLASLEKYMDSAEPMPFIVDDVLIEFDDERSAAALAALAALADSTQVILFTHHSRVMEQAQQLNANVQNLRL